MMCKTKSRGPKLNPEGRQNGWLCWGHVISKMHSLSSCGKIVSELVQATAFDSVINQICFCLWKFVLSNFVVKWFTFCSERALVMNVAKTPVFALCWGWGRVVRIGTRGCAGGSLDPSANTRPQSLAILLSNPRSVAKSLLYRRLITKQKHLHHCRRRRRHHH